MPAHRAGMQIPDQHVKPSCTKSGPFALVQKSLQGALQLMLRPVKRAGIKFAPYFAKAFGQAREMRGNEAGGPMPLRSAYVLRMISIT